MLTINTIMNPFCANVNKNLIISTVEASELKIFDYKGKKNICGNRIKESRISQKISQTDLAARLQIEGVILERDSLSIIENGIRIVKDYEIIVFSRVLNVPILWLLGVE